MTETIKMTCTVVCWTEQHASQSHYGLLCTVVWCVQLSVQKGSGEGCGKQMLQKSPTFLSFFSHCSHEWTASDCCVGESQPVLDFKNTEHFIDSTSENCSFSCNRACMSACVCTCMHVWLYVCHIFMFGCRTSGRQANHKYSCWELPFHTTVII